MDVHATLYPFYITTKMMHVAVTSSVASTKIWGEEKKCGERQNVWF